MEGTSICKRWIIRCLMGKNSGVSAVQVGVNYLLFVNIFVFPLLESHLRTITINARYL